ncbi:L-xylulose reductase [Orchesella cincta]|uniref:L-xylulose reductase n=1 Tax=Orchesella cincta TaxID=48709 RepID=A0A1D2ML17_ORCCI|nr:L-xylulose reductase [Orchesella cincta]
MSMSTQTAFVGKKCLVTGAGRGIGRAIVAELYARGATVYALSKNPSNLESLKKDFPNVIPICVDLSNWEEVKKVVEPLEALDVLINNAGINEPCTFLEITGESFDRVFNINLKAVMQISQIVAKKMIERGEGGSIINMSSMCSVRPLPRAGIYTCAKAGLDMLTKVMAVDLGPYKIRVNSVNPALVMTDMTAPVRPEPNEEENEIIYNILQRIPTGVFFVPVSDVVNTTLFLASDETSQINGQCLAVDGGYLAT